MSDDERRLELLAGSADGCTEAGAHGFAFDLMVAVVLIGSRTRGGGCWRSGTGEPHLIGHSQKKSSAFSGAKS
jgi:hypothetical protein